MKHLDSLLELVDNEIGSISQNGKFRSRDEVDTAYKLIDIAKDVYCIWKYEDGDSMSEYSEGYGYDGGGSYARGRGRGAKRYANGQYAPYSHNDGGSYYGGRSYRGMNYSRADGNQEYIENLREMMQNAPDENTRQSIQRMIQQMEQ